MGVLPPQSANVLELSGWTGHCIELHFLECWYVIGERAGVCLGKQPLMETALIRWPRAHELRTNREEKSCAHKTIGRWIPRRE